MLCASLFTCQPPAREYEAGRVLQRNGDIRPLGRHWLLEKATRYPDIENNVFPLTAIPETDPRFHEADMQWRREQQELTGLPPATHIRYTTHLPKQMADLSQTVNMSQELFGTSIVSCIKITKPGTEDEMALYFCLSVGPNRIA